MVTDTVKELEKIFMTYDSALNKLKLLNLKTKNDKEITTMATLSAQGIQTIESNKVKAIIEYDEEAHKGNQGGSDKPSPTGKYGFQSPLRIPFSSDTPSPFPPGAPRGQAAFPIPSKCH